MKQGALSIAITGLLCCGLLFRGHQVQARTLVLIDSLSAHMKVETVSRIALPPGTDFFTSRIAQPPNLATMTIRQRVTDYRLDVHPQPDRVEKQWNKGGCMTARAVFDFPPDEITITRSFMVKAFKSLTLMKIDLPFPWSDYPPEAKSCLAGTALAQVENRYVQDLTRYLIQDIETQDAAINMILNWLVDNIKPSPGGPIDALGVLEARSASVEGMVNLAVAMLRYAGIPARVVTGLSASRPLLVGNKEYFPGFNWNAAHGQGRHTWIEIYIPNVGWMECDPGGSRYFVSPYTIRFAAGLDTHLASIDGVMTGQGPGTPKVREVFSVRYFGENMEIAVGQEMERPRNLVLSAPLNHDWKDLQSVAPRIPPPEPFHSTAFVKKKVVELHRKKPAAIGYVDDFKPPDNLIYLPVLDEVWAVRMMLQHPCNRPVGSNQSFLQGVFIQFPMELASIGLALQSGPGRAGQYRTVMWSDRAGRPFEMIFQSPFLEAGDAPEGTDAVWVDFQLQTADPVVLTPGQYWLELVGQNVRDAAWACQPGNPYGAPLDTLIRDSGTKKIVRACNCDFYFRLQGFQRVPRFEE